MLPVQGRPLLHWLLWISSASICTEVDSIRFSVACLLCTVELQGSILFDTSASLDAVVICMPSACLQATLRAEKGFCSETRVLTLCALSLQG